jgi:hypothetical protein
MDFKYSHFSLPTYISLAPHLAQKQATSGFLKPQYGQNIIVFSFVDYISRTPTGLSGSSTLSNHFPDNTTILLYRRKEVSTSDLSRNKLILLQISHTMQETGNNSFLGYGMVKVAGL